MMTTKDRYEAAWTFSWSNWTFGFWKSRKLRRWGLDIGPIEYVSKRK